MTVRLYLAADADALRSLRDESAVRLPAFAAESEDEQDEFAALSSAADLASVVVVADVDVVDSGDDQELVLEDVAALHLDVDGSGDLAWYGVQELDTVLDLLAARRD